MVMIDQIKDRPPEHRSLAASSNILCLAAVSRFSSGLETSVVVSSNKSEIGGGENLIKQDISSLDLSARLLLLLNGKLRARGGVVFRSNETNQNENPEAPASFVQFGIKGRASFKVIENLRLVAAIELRNKTLFDQTETFVDLNENGVWDTGESYTDRNDNGRYDEGVFDMTLPSSIISANLEYTF